jgi:hypothetical protein
MKRIERINADKSSIFAEAWLHSKSSYANPANPDSDKIGRWRISIQNPKKSVFIRSIRFIRVLSLSKVPSRGWRPKRLFLKYQLLQRGAAACYDFVQGTT